MTGIECRARAVKLAGLGGLLAVVSLIVPAGAGASMTLARGSLTDAAGRPTAGTVTAYLFPSGGGTHRLTVLARVTPGRDGHFALTSSQQRRLARAGAGRGGWADVMVEADTSRATGTTFFSVRVGAGRGGVLARSAASAKQLRLRADHAKRAQASADTCRRDILREGGTKVERVASYKRPVIIGELNNAYRDTNATFVYGRQQSAETDFSVAVAGPDGAFKLEGENHIGNEYGAKVSTTRRGPYARKVTSSFRFGRYRRTLVGNSKCVLSTVLKAEEWVGGTDDRRQKGTIRNCLPTREDAGNTSSYLGGQSFDRFALDAVTWTRGVSVQGVGLKTKSGFSQNVGTKFDFGGPKGKRHLLCGSAARPATTAGRVFSGLNPAFSSGH